MLLQKLYCRNSKVKSVLGGDFGVGLRLQEAYVAAGKALGEFINSKTLK